MDQVVQAGFTRTSDVALPDFQGFQESLAAVFIEGLKNARESLEEVAKNLQGAEKNKVLHLKEQIDNFLDQLKKQEKASSLAKVFKALGIVAMILSALVAIVVPTPLTVGLFVVSLGLFLEPMIAGDDSKIQQGLSEGFKKLNEEIGLGGSIAVMVVAMLVLAAGSVAVAGQVAKSTVPSGVSAFMEKVFSRFPDFLRNLFSVNGILTGEHLQSFMLFLEGVEASLNMARGGVQIPLGIAQYDVAKLMHEFQIEGAMADFITNAMSVMQNNVSEIMDEISRLTNLMLESTGPRN